MKQLVHRCPQCIAVIVTIFSLFNYQAPAQIIITVAGNGSGSYNGDNINSTQAQFLPTGIATDRIGNIFISDLDDSRVRKIDRNGIITTVAGTGVSGFSGDGRLAINAKLSYNWGIVLDSALNLFIVDDGESRVRKVSPDGMINTIAGIDTVNGGGYNGDNILAIKARLEHPTCIALDSTGNIYISDQSMRIRKINTAGIITTIAGTGIHGYSGDNGLAINAEIGDPFGIAVDNSGNIYFADGDNNIIRKIDKDGIISTIAGTGTVGYTGDGGSAKLATLNYPTGVAVTRDGSLSIADAFNHAIRQVDKFGIITTIVGDGSPGFNGDGSLAKNAKLNLPVGLAFDNAGDLLIADYGNARIRKVMPAPLPVTLTAFNAFYSTNYIKINWQTAAQINAAFFNVQRSADGSNFTTITKVAAEGTSSNSMTYSFNDVEAMNLAANILYYRLQSIDRDESNKYSQTVTVKLKSTHSIIIFPNPAKDVLNAEVNTSKKEMASIQITDLQGKIVMRLNTQLYVGVNHLSINISALAKGSYIININGDPTQYKQFVK